MWAARQIPAARTRRRLDRGHPSANDRLPGLAGTGRQRKTRVTPGSTRPTGARGTSRPASPRMTGASRHWIRDASAGVRGEWRGPGDISHPGLESNRFPTISRSKPWRRCPQAGPDRRKSFLLDQKGVVGVGNIYADEAPVPGRTPSALAGRLDETGTPPGPPGRSGRGAPARSGTLGGASIDDSPGRQGREGRNAEGVLVHRREGELRDLWR